MVDSNICPACEELRCVCGELERLEEIKIQVMEALFALELAYDNCYDVLDKNNFMITKCFDNIADALKNVGEQIENITIEDLQND